MPRSTWSRSGGSVMRPGSAAVSRRGCGCMAACSAYQNAVAVAATIKVPATLVLGERDMMTPAKAGRALAAAIPNARTVVLRGAGHMMMAERPDELLEALKS